MLCYGQLYRCTQTQAVNSFFRSGRGERTSHPWQQHGEPHVTEHGLEPGHGTGTRGKRHHWAHPGYAETQRHRSRLQLTSQFLQSDPDTVHDETPHQGVTCEIPLRVFGGEKFQNILSMWVSRRTTRHSRRVCVEKKASPYWGSCKKPETSTQPPWHVEVDVGSEPEKRHIANMSCQETPCWRKSMTLMPRLIRYLRRQCCRPGIWGCWLSTERRASRCANNDGAVCFQSTVLVRDNG